MDYFVPYIWNCFPHISEQATSSSLIKIDARDLDRVLFHWQECEKLDPNKVPREAFLTEPVCNHSTSTGDFVDYMLSSTAVTFGGASAGHIPHQSDMYCELAEQTGYLLAMNGFSMRYGGGWVGLMGQYLMGHMRGRAQLKRMGYPTHHIKSVQVTCAHFLLNTSKNKNRPPNEGLWDETDAAVIFPGGLTNRVDFMSSYCDALIVGPGALGTPHELYEALTSYKIGAKDYTPYVIDPVIDSKTGKRYFDNLFAFNQQIADNGMVAQDQIDKMLKRFETPKEAIDALMGELFVNDRLPLTTYRRNCERLLAPVDVEVVARAPQGRNPQLG